MSDFEAAETQVLGLSIDSRHCHKAWAESLGGVTYPLLADFHPKGEVCRAYGVWLEEPGIGDRATVLINKEGKVVWSESVGTDGKRETADLLAKCRECC